MRRAFTLIELLVICAILATMVTIGVGSIASGKGAARVKGATRDIFGAIRHARSTALVTGQPAIVTYSTETVDGEVMAKVEIVSAKLMDSSVDRSKVETLSGEPLRREKEGPAPAETAKEGEPTEGADTDGETIEEILFAPMNAEVVKGVRLKVVKGEDFEEEVTGRKMKISMFSTTDYLISRYKDAKAEAKKEDAAANAGSPQNEGAREAAAPAESDQSPVSVVWEVNGRVDPHQVWVYMDGQKPEDGLMIRIDRFGAAKVLGGDGREEE